MVADDPEKAPENRLRPTTITVGAVPGTRNGFGASSFYPQMRDSVALVHESGNNPGQAGWIMNIPPEQDFYTGDAPFP